MSVPVTQLQILRLLLQVEKNLNGLQVDFRSNATTWKAQAQAQSLPVATLAGYMNDAATAYQARLGWVDTLRDNTTAWPMVRDLWLILGGTASDFADLMSPFKTVANSLGPADKSSYAKIVTICNQILAGIDAPLSLWPE
ncbi:hypothetical protein [Sphingopyxis sp.]|uniref:hypothetical protein n=1 Tax=Sphingopyxis sp. TaxID=1908224 RepID=UPI0025DDAEBC|nr:hypothetical protein [Sphingopyxis sp.]MBK6414072.1 hypothetical protein [Sphingopyxis sp.]